MPCYSRLHRELNIPVTFPCYSDSPLRSASPAADLGRSTAPCVPSSLGHGLNAAAVADCGPFPNPDPSHHCEPSMWRSTPLRSSIMAESLLRRGSGITTGSYRAAGIERFNASSSSQRALVSLARTLLLRSWPNISLPFWGKEACGLLHDDSRSPNAILCAGSQCFDESERWMPTCRAHALVDKAGPLQREPCVWVAAAVYSPFGTPNPTLILRAGKSPHDSAYRRFGVNFDMRKSMSSPTP